MCPGYFLGGKTVTRSRRRTQSSSGSDLDCSQSPIFPLRSSRSIALRYGRPSWTQRVSNLLKRRARFGRSLPSLHCYSPRRRPLGTLETKMAASTGKRSILSILRKNRNSLVPPLQKKNTALSRESRQLRRLE